jgi:dihydrolipoamide dehydrogenase
MTKSRLVLIVLIVALIAAFFAFDLGRYLNLETLKTQQFLLDQYWQSNALITALLFAATYIVFTALSLPGAVFLTLACGAVFGLFWGTVIVSFASTIGATLAFLLARYIAGDTIREKYANRLAGINREVERDGAFYLFALRAVPLIPYMLINILMALTPIRAFTFFWVSQLGMLPATAIYVNAGNQLGKLDSLQGILSPDLFFAFLLLAIFPLLAKKTLEFIKARRVYKPFKRPKFFDRNLIVIGGGSAGLVTAYIAAAVKASVTLIEKHRMGGDCLNTGCVPSKALLRSAKFQSHIQRAGEFGFKNADAEFTFADIMERVQTIIRDIEPHDSVERYTKLGVDCIKGEARILSPFEIDINGKKLTTRNIVIATGGTPFIPPIPGIDKTAYLTSDTLWELREQPQRLLVLGGGPIGCELAQAFARLGSNVIQLEMLPRLLSREDPDVSVLVENQFKQEGIEIYTGNKAKEFIVENGRKTLICENLASHEEIRLEFDQVLVAVGRKPNTRGFGLEELGVRLNNNGTIDVNEYQQTNFPNIYACGDVAGPYQFTHTASHQAWYCAVNALFGGFKKFKTDYSVIPWATFTEPEIARVGLNETEAKEKGLTYEVVKYDIGELDRAIADSEAHGFVKVLTRPGTDQILGVTIAGVHAGDLIAEFVLAMKHGLGLNKLLGTIHIYPTFAEANKYAAGVWKKAHAPTRLLGWVERYHRWRLR